MLNGVERVPWENRRGSAGSNVTYSGSLTELPSCSLKVFVAYTICANQLTTGSMNEGGLPKVTD